MSVDVNHDNTERLLEYNVKVQNQVQHSTPNGCREYQVPMFFYQQIEHATTDLRRAGLTLHICLRRNTLGYTSFELQEFCYDTEFAACVLHEERLGNIFRKTDRHLGLNRGPLTLAVSALPPELWPPGAASLHNSQYHSVCAVRIPLGVDW